MNLIVVRCEVREKDPLNTSDHSSINTWIDIGSVPVMVSEVKRIGRLKWEKLTRDEMNNRYTKPVDNDMRVLLTDINDQEFTNTNLDNAINKVVQILRIHETGIPKSKYCSHLKPYWCEDLSRLKRIKVEAYKIWIREGRPRDRGNKYFVNHKEAEKCFKKRLKALSKEYEAEKIFDAIQSAELDTNAFWKLVKKEKSGPKAKINSIKNTGGKVVHEIDEVLNVWKGHFSNLGTPKTASDYDASHYEYVNKRVDEWAGMNEHDDFSRHSFSLSEIEKGIRNLNSRKVPGYDGITKEHLINAGPTLIEILAIIYDWIFRIEYIPLNFRKGVQVPLYRGKNACTLDVNNYRGITLLSTFNKLFEVMYWNRMKVWWTENGVISDLQGACRKGISCVHTALLLQECIATQLESYKKVFVLYLDVAKAFDSVWVGGLFFRLREIGVIGKTWRLLFKCYQNFECRVRVQSQMSDWYPL